MKRRDSLAFAASFALPGATLHAEPGSGKKVLRVVNPVAETGFDPVSVGDTYSATITSHIFDAPYEFDHLARPVKLRPRSAAAMPEVSADFRIWTVRMRPGIYFADDAAFKGHKRELTAHDAVYSLKRNADPANKSRNWPTLEESKLVGLTELRNQALQGKQPFDYEATVPGLRALDRYTFQITLVDPQPRFAEVLAQSSSLSAAVAREVVEFYGDKIAEHPVGTGPYRLVQWRRSSLIVLERNPNYREHSWDAEPAPDDAEGQAILQRMKGRRVPMIDRVEVSIIEAAQPRWLSFINRQLDVVAVPHEFVPLAMPGGQLAPYLAKKGVQGWRVLMPVTQLAFFNMEHPVVGGLAPHQVALRRAVWLAMDLEREVSLVFRGQAVVAQSIVPPGTSGYSATFKSENSDYSLARARALLDMYGYLDRDGDGWRAQPNGQPLLLEWLTQPDGLDRQLDELLKKTLDAIGVRVVFKPAQWPENRKAVRAGKFMAWRVGSSATSTDGKDALLRLYSAAIGQANLARFSLPAFDRVYERLVALPDGPEREAAFVEAKRIAAAYAAYKVRLHQYNDLLAQPWVEGFRRPLFWTEWWHLADIDASRPV